VSKETICAHLRTVKEVFVVSGKRQQRNSAFWEKLRAKKGLYVAIPLLALSLLIGGSWLLSQRQKAGSVTPTEVAAEIIPQRGAPTSYDISLSLNNTQRFIDYYNETTLAPEQKSTMRNALLPLKAPCCDDNSMATCCCPCNLAKSVWGLSSYLIVEKNYGVDQVRESALQWLRFIHSNYYVIQELKNRGIDPGAYGLSHENPCYVGGCELPFVEGGCGGMGDLIL
jgi:hypothetical protein